MVHGFTLTELLTVVVTLIFVAILLLPALAHTRSGASAFQCLNNHQQLMRAWRMYAADFGDRVPNNFTLPDTIATITSGRFETWANNVMTWGAGASIEDRSNTNEMWIRNGVFAQYTGDSVEIYLCPSDVYLSPVQVRAGWARRNRSVSMNGLVGRSDRLSSSATGRSWMEAGSYRQFLKTSDVSAPAMTWVTIDEHPDSINDGFFVVSLNANQWGDLPASYHGGACTFAFVDGHAEIWKWLSSTSVYKVTYNNSLPVRPFDPAGRQDFEWYKARTGYILYR